MYFIQLIWIHRLYVWRHTLICKDQHIIIRELLGHTHKKRIKQKSDKIKSSKEACLTIYMHVHITITVPQNVYSHCLFHSNSRKDYFIQWSVLTCFQHCIAMIAFKHHFFFTACCILHMSMMVISSLSTIIIHCVLQWYWQHLIVQPHYHTILIAQV